MQSDTDLVAFDPFWASLTLCDDLKFADELIGRFLECLLVDNLPTSALSAQLKAPVFNKILRLRQACLLRASSAILAREIRRALPMGRISTFMDVYLPTQDRVICRHQSTLLQYVQVCVTSV